MSATVKASQDCPPCSMPLTGQDWIAERQSSRRDHERAPARRLLGCRLTAAKAGRASFALRRTSCLVVSRQQHFASSGCDCIGRQASMTITRRQLKPCDRMDSSTVATGGRTILPSAKTRAQHRLRLCCLGPTIARVPYMHGSRAGHAKSDGMSLVVVLSPGRI